MSKKPPPPPVAALQSIDPSQLAHVSGGASRVASADGGSGGADASVKEALTGILDSLKSLSSQQSQGFGPTEMMMFMMLLQGRQQAPVAAIPNGVTVNGVWYPFK